jgi:hypothetical protein
VVATVGVVTTLVVIVGGLVLVATRQWLPGISDCTATSGDRTVGLSTDDAQRAARAAARSVRRNASLPRAATAVARVADLSDGDARVVAAALTGRAWHALSCRHGGSDSSEPDRLDARGLTARAETVRRDLVAAFGPQKLGGYAPGGVTTGHMPGSAHYEGRAVDVFYRPVDRPGKVRGWATAQYLVANADRLAIDTVIFDARIWTARRSLQGWRDYSVDTSGRSRAVARILEHRDHVHVDVAD